MCEDAKKDAEKKVRLKCRETRLIQAKGEKGKKGSGDGGGGELCSFFCRVFLGFSESWLTTYMNGEEVEEGTWATTSFCTGNIPATGHKTLVCGRGMSVAGEESPVGGCRRCRWNAMTSWVRESGS